MRRMVNPAEEGQRSAPDRFFGILSQHLAGLAETGALGAVPDPDLWGSVAAAGGKPTESTLTAAAELGRNWRRAGYTAVQFVEAQAALRQKIWALCALYADEPEAQMIGAVSLIDRWLDSIGLRALGELQSAESAARAGLEANVQPHPAEVAILTTGLLPGSISTEGDEELARLIAEVAELESRRDGLQKEIGVLINVVREKS